MDNLKAMAELHGYVLVRKEKKNMISMNNGRAEIKGTKITLMTELTCLLNYFIEKGIASVDDLHEAVYTASLSDEKLHQMTLDALIEALRKLKELNND